jgi:hypothetical protein
MGVKIHPNNCKVLETLEAIASSLVTAIVLGKISPKISVRTKGTATVNNTLEVVPTMVEITFCTPKLTVTFKISNVTNRDFGFSKSNAAACFPLCFDILNVFLFDGERENNAVSELEKNALYARSRSNSKHRKKVDITLIYPIKYDFLLPFRGNSQHLNKG